MNAAPAPAPLLLAIALATAGCGPASLTLGAGDDDDSTGESSGGDDPCSYGESVLDPSLVHDIQLTFSDGDWAEIIEIGTDACEYCDDPRPYFPAAMTVDGVDLEGDVGVRLKGHSSLMFADWENHIFPFKVDFNEFTEGQEFEGLKKLNLHANREGYYSVVEHMAYGAVRDHLVDGTTQVAAPRTAFTHLTVNGEDLGLYNAVEQINGAFLDCHFPEPRGHLYKPEEPSEHLSLPFESYDEYPSLHFKWGPEELEDPEAPVDHSAVGQMINTIHHGLPEAASVLDTDGVLLYHALNVGLGNHDYYGSYGHNYYLYEVTPGVFTMIVWDLNEAFTVFDGPCGAENWGKPLNHHLLRDPGYVERYGILLADFLEGAVDSVDERRREALDLVGDEVREAEIEEIRERAEWGMEWLSEEAWEGIDPCED